VNKIEIAQQNSTKKIKIASIKTEEKNATLMRNCPKCAKEMTYTDKWYYNDSIKKNRKCVKCKDVHKNRIRKFGKDNSNYKGIMDKSTYHRPCPNCGIDITYTLYETYRKSVSRNRGCGCITTKSWACYNVIACKIFDEINKEMGWNGRHAENGGERKVSKYWVDYYEPNLNLVIEYDEKWHKYHTQYDAKRELEIIQYLGCKFYRIREGQNWREVINEL
jgi:hypothetical protein